jgi:hypothetical protein
MKQNFRFAVLFSALLATTTLAAPAHADVDDEQRIAQCLDDNDDSGQTEAVLMSYCSCANEAMSSSDQQTITEWEKRNADDQEECSKTAGWKY